MEDAKSISSMIRMTSWNSNDFFGHVADHIESLEETIRILRKKLSEYEDLSDQEIDDHK